MWDPKWKYQNEIDLDPEKFYLVACDGHRHPFYVENGKLWFSDGDYAVAEITDDIKSCLSGVDKRPPEGAFIIAYSEPYNMFYFEDSYKFDKLGDDDNCFGLNHDVRELNITGWTMITSTPHDNDKFDMTAFCDFLRGG